MRRSEGECRRAGCAGDRTVAPALSTGWWRERRTGEHVTWRSRRGAKRPRPKARCGWRIEPLAVPANGGRSRAACGDGAPSTTWSTGALLSGALCGRLGLRRRVRRRRPSCLRHGRMAPHTKTRGTQGDTWHPRGHVAPHTKTLPPITRVARPHWKRRSPLKYETYGTARGSERERGPLCGSAGNAGSATCPVIPSTRQRS
jgi:hypothetical protein